MSELWTPGGNEPSPAAPEEPSEDELNARLAAWKAPAPRYTHGVFAKYARGVSSAAEGAVTR